MTDPILVLIGLACIAGVLYSLVLFSKVRSPEQVICPADGEPADVTVERRRSADWSSGSASDIVGCDRFEDPDDVTCEKRCL